MKKIICAARVLSVAALLVFSRCDREKDLAPNTPACKPVKLIVNTVPESQIVIEYNAQDRLVRYTSQREGQAGDCTLREYNNTGHLIKSTLYGAEGRVLDYQVYEYNQAAQVV